MADQRARQRRTGQQRPSPERLFALYHLGVDESGAVRFCNLHDCAKILAVSPADLQNWLESARIDQETATRVGFNISRAHVDAQLAESPTEALRIARDAFAAFVVARDQGGVGEVQLDIDYDDL